MGGRTAQAKTMSDKQDLIDMLNQDDATKFLTPQPTPTPTPNGTPYRTPNDSPPIQAYRNRKDVDLIAQFDAIRRILGI